MEENLVQTQTNEIVGTLLFLALGVIITWYQIKYFK